MRQEARSVVSHLLSVPNVFASGTIFRARIYPHANFHYFLALLIFFLALPVFSVQATPITAYTSYAGNINFLSVGATFRTQPDAAFGGNPCVVEAAGVTTSADLSTALRNQTGPVLTGLPAGATVIAAHLYWAGSYSTQAGSTRTTPDWDVTFNGVAITADRQFIELFATGPYSLDYFGGYADVTADVVAGVNSLTDLSVNTAAQHCTVSAVLSGWALHVIYEDAATEPLRVINVYDGLQYFWSSSITLNPSNFVIDIPDGKLNVTTWEGDVGNSGASGGFAEELRIDGNLLTDAINPLNNQYNSTINTTNPASPANTTYGVDVDTFDISAYLSAGQSTASLYYASGGDLVMLGVEIFSSRNTPVADLVMAKSHVGDFVVDGNNATYTLTASNAGPNPEPGPITVTDTIPAGLTYVSAAGTGWGCVPALPNVTCTNLGPLAAGNALPDITLTVTPTTVAAPSVINSATVAGTEFDNVSANNTANDPTNVLMASLTNLKMVAVYSDPINGTTNPTLAIPGAVMEYTILITNSGGGPVTLDSVFVEDPIPADTALVVADIAGAGSGPVLFIDGATTSALSYTFTSLASVTDDLEFSQTASPGPYVYSGYTPVADGSGVDTTVTAIRINPKGTMAAAAGGNNPSFSLRFRVRVP